MVFSPYRLFCFLLLKRAGISTLQASFTYNETAAAWKVSIHDFFLANTMHDFLYSICSAKCKGFSSVQAYSESRYISRKTKAVGLPPYRLMFIFSQRRRHDYHMAFSLLESVHWIAPPASSLFGKLLHPRKAKRYSFHPYRLTFFCQCRRHDYHMVFLSTRICILPASSLFGKLLHPRKSKRYSFHPYRLMFIFSQRKRHDCRRAFSLLESVHRIAPPASSLFGKLLHPRKSKRYSFHPYRLMFIFCQHRRHDCHMAFSLPESVHQIALPVQTHEK